LFLNGVSTRKLSRIAKELVVVELSSSTVSDISKAIRDEDLKQFQNKSIYLQFALDDGKYARGHI